MSDNPGVTAILSAIAFIAVCAFLIFGSLVGCGAVKSFQRSQKVKDANNSVRITSIYVKRQQQEARRIAARDGVVHALADQRVIQAHGIAEAQRLIAKTLTPLYVQFEAIQNQANGRGERIYIPVGAQGVPLVANVNGNSLNTPGQ